MSGARRTLRHTAAFAPLALGALLLPIACDGASAEESPLIGRDLSMLELMLQIDPLFRSIEPGLRNPERMEPIAAAAQAIAGTTEDPIFTGYTERGDFARDPEPFERFRRDLAESSEAAAAAARAGDLDALHEAYAGMAQSCVACHKRYSPTY